MTALTAAHHPAPRRGAAPGAVRALSGSLVAAVLLVSFVIVGAAPASASTCDGPIGDGEIRVSIVVDSDSTGMSTDCLVVPSGTTGSQLLARRAAALGRSAPRYAQSGLLCAIDGFPASGCGDRSSGGFAYWAYFNGTSGSWVYGTYNPFIRRLSDGDVEGWRFVGSGGDAGDPPPRTSPPRLGPVVRATVPSAATGAAPVATPGAVPGSVGPSSANDTPDVIASDTVTASTMVPLAATDPGESVDGALVSASHGSGGSVTTWVMLAVVALVVLALAAGAFVRARSTR